MSHLYIVYNIIVSIFVIVCGGVIDASINGNIELPIRNINHLHCRWDLTNTNGSIVIEADLKINETKTVCPYDYLLLVTNGKYNIIFYFCNPPLIKYYSFRGWNYNFKKVLSNFK